MAVQKRTSTNVLLDTALKNFYAAAEEMGLEDGLVEVMSRPERAICVSIPVQMDDGSVRVFNGYRVQHSTVCGPAKGGLRFHPDVNLEECEALASLMTWKCSLAGIPYGGGKGGISVDPFELSPRERETMTRTFAARIAPFIGDWTDVPAPDVNTNAEVMGWVMDTYSMKYGYPIPGVVTGKAFEIGGSLGRPEATGRGVMLCCRALTEKLGLDIKDCTFAVQGFGNVGSTAAYLIADLGAKVVAVSDHTAAFYCADGLDVHDMLDYAAGNGRVLQGYKADGVTEIAKEDLLYTDADFLIPAALEGQITADNADRVKAKYIVEGANGPTSYEADQILNAKGKIVVPDILANAGGVIVSYFEWVQNLQSLSWSLEEVNNKLADILLKAFDEVYGLTEERGYPMRTSAYIIALRRLVKTKKIRGIFP